MAVEKLTDEERDALLLFASHGDEACAKALRIIDQLADTHYHIRENCPDCVYGSYDPACRTCLGNHYVERLVPRTRVEAHLEYHRQEDPHALESTLRRCSDLESQCASLSEDRTSMKAKLAAAESELADLRGRVKRADAQILRTFGWYMPTWPQGAVVLLEILRGK